MPIILLPAGKRSSGYCGIPPVRSPRAPLTHRKACFHHSYANARLRFHSRPQARFHDFQTSRGAAAYTWEPRAQRVGGRLSRPPFLPIEWFFIQLSAHRKRNPILRLDEIPLCGTKSSLRSVEICVLRLQTMKPDGWQLSTPETSVAGVGLGVAALQRRRVAGL